MTVIACNADMMAGDGLAVDGSIRHRVKKIHRINGDIVGYAGNCEDGQKAIDWYRNQEQEKPSLESVSLLVLKPDGSIFVYESGLIKQAINQPNYAIGSGNEYALGAMDGGATPEAAVKMCCKRLSGYQWCDVLRRK